MLRRTISLHHVSLFELEGVRSAVLSSIPVSLTVCFQTRLPVASLILDLLERIIILRCVRPVRVHWRVLLHNALPLRVRHLIEASVFYDTDTFYTQCIQND